jgi:hypothetical protein
LEWWFHELLKDNPLDLEVATWTAGVNEKEDCSISPEALESLRRAAFRRSSSNQLPFGHISKSVRKVEGATDFIFWLTTSSDMNESDSRRHKIRGGLRWQRMLDRCAFSDSELIVIAMGDRAYNKKNKLKKELMSELERQKRTQAAYDLQCDRLEKFAMMVIEFLRNHPSPKRIKMDRTFPKVRLKYLRD